MSNLYEITPRVNSSLVELLEDLLERAKSGEIDGIAGITICTAGAQFGEFYSDNTNQMRVPMLGWLRVLQLRYEKEIEF